jgi:hypothetical protein
MNVHNQQLVADVTEMVAEIIKRSSARLAGVGLTPNPRPPRVTADGCELCVEFVGIGGIADVLEFHVVRGGKAVAEESAIRDWFEKALADVIERAEARLAKTRAPN